jgi:hemolysin activation/secretion protein
VNTKPVVKMNSIPLAAALLAAFCTLCQPASAQAGAATPAAPQATAALRTVLVVEADAPRDAAPLPAGVLLRVDELDREPLRGLLGTQLGQQIEPPLVEALVAEVNRALARNGRRFTVAAAPDQDVTDGVLRIEVQRGRLGKLAVTGDGDSARIQSQLRVRQGDLLDAGPFEADLAWLERAQPGRRAVAALRPGSAPGEVEVEVRVAEPPRVSGSLGLDNTGNEFTGTERVSLGIGAARLLHADDQLSYRLSASPNFQNAVTHKLDYRSALPWRHLLGVSLTGSYIKSKVPEPLNQSGRSEEAALRYEVPLRLSGAWTDGLVLTGETKRSDNNLLFSDLPVTDTVMRIRQVSIAYEAAVRDPWGSTRGTATFIASPGDLGAYNDDASFQSVRSGATARYNIVRAQLSRQTPLGPGLEWQIGLNAQWAGARLLGSEQISAGGVASVRGFTEGSAYGDSGVVLRNDLRLPSIRLAPEVTLSPSLFIDGASLRIRDPQPGERSQELASVGGGVEAWLPYKVYLSAFLGYRVRSTLTSQPKDGGEAHLALQWYWP